MKKVTTAPIQAKLKKLKSLGVFNLAHARAIGIPQQTVSWLLAENKIERLARGVYKILDAEIDPEEEEYAIACAQFEKPAYIGGLTALFYHRLLDRVPLKIWLVVPPLKRNNQPKYTIIRSKENLQLGIDVHSNFRMASVERSLVDAFRYASKVGLQLAIRAMRQAAKDKKTTPNKVLKLATDLGVKQYVLKHWEAIAMEHE